MNKKNKKTIFGIIILIFLISIISLIITNNNEPLKNWDSDNIILMQHSIDKTYACFGCSQKEFGKAMCVDPIKEMREVAETKFRYCNNNFEVIEDNEFVGNVGETCKENIDCSLPMEFGIQSNCPFISMCIDSKCSVVCPIIFNDIDFKIHSFTCNVENECDCSERGNRSIDCICIDNDCFSVEKN